MPHDTAPMLEAHERMVLEFVSRFGQVGRLLPLGRGLAAHLGEMSLVARNGNGWRLTQKGRDALAR